jgi:hypothetical protein
MVNDRIAVPVLADRDLASRIHVRNAAEGGQTRTVASGMRWGSCRHLVALVEERVEGVQREFLIFFGVTWRSCRSP